MINSIRGSIGLLIITTLLSVSCKKSNQATITLDNNWKFRKAGETEWLTANVPGCVHTDLLEKKLIPDPFYQKNELKVKWVEDTDWEYTTSFNFSDEMEGFSNIDLQFEGLDTYADVYLNDSLVLKADNMFIGWTIPAKKFLKKGDNNLRIYFHSAVKIGMEKLKKVPYLIMAANEIAPENERTNVFTRKAPFHYGWDWGPRLVTCGVWKPVKLIAWNDVKLDDLYIKPIRISADTAVYKAIAELSSEKITKAVLEVWVENTKVKTKKIKIVKGLNTVDVDFEIEKPELWWTNGLGGHKLYTVEMRMVEGNITQQTITKKIGVRTLELVREKDSIGNTFLFRLNGIPVFMKGANYIPSDIFTTRNTIENYKRVVDDAVKGNMNMLRIWGGAIYENDEFYDLLDENGILAWNDFMFACNMQPDDSLHLENIRKEAEYNVKRLRNHPSIALWCGNNENLRAWSGWGWKEKVTKEQGDILWKVYEKIYYDILPKAVLKYHPEISYWPSSPQAENNKNSNFRSGDEHDWRIWFGDVPFSTYADKTCRFISEYGLQSFAEMKTIRSFASDSDMAYRSPVMEHRQRSLMPWIGKDFNGNEMIKTYINRYYKPAKNFESFVYLSQVMQAEGVKFAVETHRKNMPFTMGSLYWQINDCWPTMSWSGVDYFGRWKALHYFVRNAFEPIIAVPFTDNKNFSVSIVSDKLSDENANLLLKLYDFRGRELLSKEIKIVIKANQSSICFTIPKSELTSMGNPSELVMEVILNSDGHEITNNLFYFKDCKELNLEEVKIERNITRKSSKEYEIIMSTDKLAKNVALTTIAEGFFSDNYFDMIPGKEYKILFTGEQELTASQLKIQCVNESF